MSSNSFTEKIEDESYVLPSYNEYLEPKFNPHIYQGLPLAMRDLFVPIANRHERDILLLGTITVLSGCMPNVIGVYDGRIVCPNLYTFIEAPAGAGKGVLSWARELAYPIHKMLCEETRAAREQYLSSKKEKAKQKKPDGEILTEPPYKMLFIPVNNSASSMVQTLSENDSSGILFSTEADSLANSLSQDWGNFSDVLRCAFHHEPIELQRRLNREYISIEKPKLSVLLTGTRGQLLRLIPNTENGLFSRFIFYSFPAVPHFRNVFDPNGTKTGQAFNKMGQTVLESYTYLKQRTEPLEFYLTDQDKEKFLSEFKDITAFTYKESGDQILGTVLRLGLMTFRIGMVLSTIRHFTNPNREEQNRIKIHKCDFTIALELAYHILCHATLVIAEMKDGSKQVLHQSRLTNLNRQLPETFTKAEALKVAKTLNISNATLGRYLEKSQFERVAQGKYRKIVINKPDE